MSTSGENPFRGKHNEDPQLLKDLIEHSGDVILLHDLEGRCMYCGGSGRFGYAEKDVLGKRPIELLGDGRGESLQTALLAVARTGKSMSIESVSTCGNVQRWFRDMLHPVHDTAGRLVAVGLVRRDITEQKRLEESERRHRIAAELVSDYVYFAEVPVDGPARQADWIFGAFEDITGYRVEDLAALPQGWLSVVHPDDRPIVEELLRDQLRNESRTVEYRIITRQGQTRWLRDSSRPIRDETSGRVARICGAVHDITLRRRAEQALKDSEAWYRTLHDSSPVGLATIRVDDCRIRSVNPALCGMLGYTETELLGKTVRDITHPDDLHLDEDAIRQRQTGDRGLMQFEKRLLHKDGNKVWVELTSAPLTLHDDEPLTILGIVKDITERKEAERKLDETKSNLALAARTAGLGYWSFDVREDAIHWSPECCDIFGVPFGPVRTNRDFMDLIHPADRQRVGELHEQYLADRDEASMECRIVRADNKQVRHVKLVGQCHRNERGEPVRVVGSVMDVTMDRRAEEALTFAHQQLRAVLDAIPACVHVVDRDFHVMELNHHALHCTNLARRADVLGRKCYEVFRQRHQPCEDCSIPDVLATGRPATRIMEGDPLCQGGKVCKVFSNPIRDNNGGGVLGVVEVVMDITDLKRAEEQRQELASRAQRLAKLESLASLAGGIAHDFNNLLVAVMGNADLALRELPPDSSVRELMGEIKHASLRAADLTGQMLAYSGRGRLVFKPIDLNGLIRDLCNDLKKEVSERIECRLDLEESLPEVPADREQFSQLVRNLLVNAAEAIGSEFGQVCVRTRIETCRGSDQTPEGYVGETLRQGQYINFQVQDTGIGMDEQTQGRLFDPFFTTKFTGRGLGLAAALGIARGHGGGIEVASRPGEGSTFTVRIPLPTSEKRNGEPVEEADPPHRWTVLFADDEPNVRTIARRMLSQAGFKVLVGEDGQEAIDLFEAHCDEIDVVILDMVMPTCDGQCALEAIRAARSDVPVLFCSGYSETELSGDETQARPDGYIQKPFDMQEFLDTVEHFARR